MLLRVYKMRGIRPASLAPVSCSLDESDKTLASNLNGGVYVIQRRLLTTLGSCWRNHATWLLERVSMLSKFGYHIDQIAMALAIDEMGVGVTHFDARANCPIHLSQERLSKVDVPGIEVLHYHSLIHPGETVIRKTGLLNLDAAIRRANMSMRSILSTVKRNERFQTWYRSSIVPLCQRA
jgi:hypothetical protein